MDRMIFVNLPAHDLAAARRFYTGVGFEIDETFSDEQCVCVVVSPSVLVMVVDRARFADLVTTPVADARATAQVLNCLSAASREEVDAFVAAAVASGGSEYRGPGTAVEGVAPDGDTMYGRAVTDPDGHVWELLYSSP